MKLNLLKMAVISLTIASCTLSTSSTNQLHPIILIPGSGGNQLEARLTPEYKPSSVWCNRWYPAKKDRDGWFRLWFDPTVILKPFTRCFNERMMLYYDPSVDDYHNAPGVETRVPHFGSVEGLLYLDPSLKRITSYMQPLVKSLEPLGYSTDNKNLFGAPYDFRYGLAPQGHPDRVGSNYLSALKALIESAFESNGGKPAILLSHSLGGLMALQLLDRSLTAWRRKYVKHFIAMSAPWGGTVEVMRTFASGNTFGVPLVDPLLVRPEQRSASSNLWLLPSPSVFEGSKPLVVTRRISYNSSDISDFLEDIGFGEGVRPYKTRILPLVEDLPVLDVPVTCIFGSGIKTSDTLFYGENGFDEGPEVVYGDGDGTVNMASLLGLETMWRGEKNVSVKVVKIPGISHTSILKDENALKRVSDEVSCVNSGMCSSFDSLVLGADS